MDELIKIGDRLIYKNQVFVVERLGMPFDGWLMARAIEGRPCFNFDPKTGRIFDTQEFFQKIEKGQDD